MTSTDGQLADKASNSAVASRRATGIVPEVTMDSGCACFWFWSRVTLGNGAAFQSLAECCESVSTAAEQGRAVPRSADLPAHRCRC